MNLENDILYKKRLEYRDYIDEHILNVKKAWNIVKTVCDYILIDELGYISVSCEIIESNIIMHDRSKYGLEEFEPYRKYFYPISKNEKEKCKNEFDKAWVHHYMNNPHHWDYWWAIKSKMPIQFVVEMICDWIAMGIKFNEKDPIGDTIKWYNDNYKDIHFIDDDTTMETRALIKRFLDALKNNYEERKN